MGTNEELKVLIYPVLWTVARKFLIALPVSYLITYYFIMIFYINATVQKSRNLRVHILSCNDLDLKQLHTWIKYNRKKINLH